jgi:hypothetical protein
LLVRVVLWNNVALFMGIFDNIFHILSPESAKYPKEKVSLWEFVRELFLCW